MAPKHAAHSHPWKISDVVIFPLLAVGFLLEWLWSSSLPLPRSVSLWVGLLVAVLGFALIQWSKRVLDRHEQPSLPELPTTKLVKEGPFRVSRNPNYLGAGIAIAGGGLAANSVWVLISGALALVIIDRWLIAPEEKYLEGTFGAEYFDYKATVRRWL